MKYLVLAEKDSLAKFIAQAFRRSEKKNGYYRASDPEIGEADIYFTFGHILRVDVKKTLEQSGYPDSFPVYPDRLLLSPDPARKSLFKGIYDAVKSGRYDAVVNAGDPDREGELLIREVLYFCSVKKPVYRLWFNSLTASELRRAFKELKPAREFDSLYEAARGRQYADFFLGINGSIALQKKLRTNNQSIGRVQTPVLKLIVDREKEIRDFKPEKYSILKAVLHKDVDFECVWVDLKKKENRERLSPETARQILEKLKGVKTARVVTLKKERKSQNPPLLPKLSDVQIEAGNLYKFKASNVLRIVQALYEKKLVSYPRTDSNYLSVKDKGLVIGTLKKLGRSDLADNIPKRMFNDRDVAEAGHHAIIPLNRAESFDNEEEKKIYNLILRRFLAQFYPPYEYESTSVVFDIGGETFRSTGRKTLRMGWRELYGKDPEEQEIPSLKEGETLPVKGFREEEKQTQPPPRYTSASLIKAMVKLGLGTQATRSSYEPLLLNRGYITVQRNQLVPTNAGFSIIDVVGSMRFASPEYTAEWEKLLDDIAKRRIPHGEGVRKLLGGVKTLTDETCRDILSSGITKESMETSVGRCSCGGVVIETPKTYRCKECGKYVFKTVFGKKLTQKQALSLLQGKKVKVKGLKSKKGKKFEATLNLKLVVGGEKWRVELEFL